MHREASLHKRESLAKRKKKRWTSESDKFSRSHCTNKKTRHKPSKSVLSQEHNTDKNSFKKLLRHCQFCFFILQRSLWINRIKFSKLPLPNRFLYVKSWVYNTFLDAFTKPYLLMRLVTQQQQLVRWCCKYKRLKQTLSVCLFTIHQ